uniref:Uncharacterized protein n=1 Tax=Romanomermis culicivorax TaxID=13658 RepID=A0A915KP39_ROMCU
MVPDGPEDSIFNSDTYTKANFMFPYICGNCAPTFRNLAAKMSNLDARLSAVEAKLFNNAPSQPNMPPRFISSSFQPENIIQNLTGLNIEMLIRDGIERPRFLK